MAGRGRRLGDLTPPSATLGAIVPFPEEAYSELEVFTDKVNEIDLVNNTQTLITVFEQLVKKKCTSKELMKEIFTNLHEVALVNSDFGLKLITGVRNIICFEVEGVTLRNILLNLIQEDFASKETLSKEKFLNAVLLLGNFYNKIDIGGNPIKVLGIALLEYFDLLLKKCPDDLKVLFIQIVINNGNLLNDNTLSEKYNSFYCNLRNALINGNLKEESKCWVLMAIEYISAGLRQNNVEVGEDFYVKKLGSSYLELQPIIANSLAAVKKNNVNSNEKKTLQNDKESRSNFGSKSHEKMQRSNYAGRNYDESMKKRNDISERFSGLKVGKSENDNFKNRKGKMGGLQQNHNKTPRKDHKKWNSEGRYHFDHDDRCEKDENFYGTQAPRLPRHGKQKQDFEDDRKSEKGDGDSKSLNSSSESAEQKIETWN